MTAIPRCKNGRGLDWSRVGPGETVHLATGSVCRAFLIASDKLQDPITGNEGYRVMEIGDDKITEGAEPPFTGVVLTLYPHAASQWHTPDAP